VFEVGLGEILLTGVVALLVLGPERLPQAARVVGLWVGRLRRQWDGIKQDWETELQAEELRRNLDSVRNAAQQTEQELKNNDVPPATTAPSPPAATSENTIAPHSRLASIRDNH